MAEGIAVALPGSLGHKFSVREGKTVTVGIASAWRVSESRRDDRKLLTAARAATCNVQAPRENLHNRALPTLAIESLT